jgi:hypothetical protein
MAAWAGAIPPRRAPVAVAPKHAELMSAFITASRSDTVNAI